MLHMNDISNKLACISLNTNKARDQNFDSINWKLNNTSAVLKENWEYMISHTV